MSGFNFGNTAGTSAGSSGSLFGTAGAKSDGKSIFGSNTGSTSFSFGQPSAAAAAASSSNDSQSKTKNLFGSGAASSSNPFGSKKDDKNPEANKAAFSGFPSFGGAAQTPGTPAQPASTNIFGSTTPATTNNPFGKMNSSTTPAGQPPATGSLFGASTGTSSQPQSAIMPAFSFGKPANAPSDQQPATASQPPPSLFSNFGKAAGSSIFSNPASTNDASSKPAGFGGFNLPKPAENLQSKPAPSFSFMQPKANDKPADAATRVDQPKQSGFSFPATTATSSVTSQTTTSQPAVPNPFSQQSTSSQSKPSLFSPTTASSSTNNFFAKPATPSSQNAETPKTGGFSFPSLGSLQPVSTSTQPETSAGTTKSFFPGFATTTSSASAAIPSATTAAAAPSLFKLGGTTASTAEAATPTTTAAAPAPFFKLGETTASSSSAATSTTAAIPPFNLGGTTVSSSSAPVQNAATAPSAAVSTTAATVPAAGLGMSTLSASTTGPLAPVQSRLRNKTMDEILTRWASDLTRYTKDFKTHAETIARWDQIIVDNSAKIDKLYVKTRTCEKQTMSVEMQLSAVENQHNELEAWLNKYENDVDEMLAKDGSQPELGGPDQERERMYQLAQRLGEQLDDMGRDLQSMVEEVNAANASLGKNSKTDEPVTQIVKILNSHLSQLQAIDQGTNTLQAKITAAQKAAGGLSYLNSSMNGDSQTAADGFYRSYMGRR